MPNAIYGKDIKTLQDLQNVVTVLIFRNNIFTVEKIVSQAKQLIKTSSLKIEDKDLEKMIVDSLTVFEKNELIHKRNEIYITKPKEQTTHVTVLD